MATATLRNGTARSGLTQAEAARRLVEQGPNVIVRQDGKGALRMLVAQFASPMIWLLLGAAVLSGVLGELADTIAIAAIVLLNAVVGFFQEFGAEKSLLALRAMTAPRARILRDGAALIVPAETVVVGDCLLLEAGDIVAADAKLIEAHNLTTNEAPLTGESASVEKSTAVVESGAPLAERHDCVFLGTAVANGTGVAEVFATAMQTELGHIAHLLSSTEESETPLERRLAVVSRALLFVCIGVVGLVAVLGVLRGAPWLEVLLSSVSLAVAAVPEGLPAVVTVALALGVQRMAARHVLVRRLPAVETLGCATVICTDKTGTLTTGVMTVRDSWGKNSDALFFAAAACCDAELGPDSLSGIGDTTEIALLVEAAKRGIHRRDIERARPRVATNPFDSDRKRMSIKRSDGILYVKGAVEVIIARCSHGSSGATEENKRMAERGLRVLAIATGASNEENDLRLLGLIGIADPPRSEAIDAIRQARRAGVRTVMITGDHPVTASAIARELGLLSEGEDPQLVVHARATAASKLTIVREWKRRGAVVAMTGDGVNDAPAIKEAHIGIAMGKAGTEVTREAADMVLTDDNFASIVAAVREGRGIYDNIRKALVYLLAGNAGELLLFLAASIAGLPLPLLPLHLLWINLVTDGFPALALVTEPVEQDALDRPPRDPSAPILGRAQWMTIAWTGALQAACALSVFVWALDSRSLNEARNLAFSTLVFGEVLRTFAARSETKVLWEVGVFTNLRVLFVVSVTAFIQLAIHNIPAAMRFFDTLPLSLSDCLLSVSVGLIPVSVLELTKLVSRVWEKRAKDMRV